MFNVDYPPAPHGVLVEARVLGCVFDGIVYDGIENLPAKGRAWIVFSITSTNHCSVDRDALLRSLSFRRTGMGSRSTVSEGLRASRERSRRPSRSLQASTTSRTSTPVRS